MQSFMITLLTCSVSMSMLALIYMAVTPLLVQRYSVKWLYYAWLIVVIGLVIPFRPQFNNAIVKIDMMGGAAGAPYVQIGNGLPVAIHAPVKNATLPPLFSWWQIAVAVWLVGVIAFLAYQVIKHYRFMKMVKRWSEDITDKQALTVFDDLKTEMGISKRIRLYLCASVGSPMMIGFVTPRIVLPKVNLENGELRLILKHELVHYRRKDLWYKCILLIATAIHWFNPIAYLMARAIDALCETSCDAEVVRDKDVDTRQRYSETIIRVAKSHSQLVTALSTNLYGGKENMKNRILSIMDTGKKAAGGLVIGGVLLSTLGTGIAFAATAHGGNSVQASQAIHHSTANGASAASSQAQSSAPASTAGGYTLMNLMNDSQTPGPQDLSVQKAAEDAASALNQKYGLDLTGYKFYPGFYKGAAPNTDIWAFKINTPPNTVPWTYVVTMNAVTGQILVVGK